MKIVQVTNKTGYSSIPLRGWGSVVAAVNTYATYGGSAARATTQNQIEAIGDTYGGMALSMYMLNAPHMRQSSQFVDGMLQEAQKALLSRKKWSRSYDYDGQGVFFKTTVEIGILDANTDMYYLSIYAAYVGDKPEAELAESLNIPRGLTGCTVIAEVAPANDTHFVFNYDVIIHKLSTVLPWCYYTGEQALELLKANSADDRTGDTAVPIYMEGDIIVSISPGRVNSRFNWKNGVGTDTWTFDGGILAGLLAKSYTEGKSKDEPTFMVRVTRHSPDKYQRNPFYLPEDKNRVLQLAQLIAEALSH